MKTKSLALASLCVALVAATSLSLLSQTALAPAPEKKDEQAVKLDSFNVSAGGSIGYAPMGATPGGAKDVNFFRMGANRGEVPRPETFTPEGLFSQHDLPLKLAGKRSELLWIESAATPARFEALPDVRYLAQLGFASSYNRNTWERAPLNLVAVVDKSGSMEGPPLALVRASLQSVLRQLRDGDQLSIVLYGDRAHVHLAPTPIDEQSRATISYQIEAITSAGSTYMEAGLRLGYDVARESSLRFHGATRVMLFTDEQPNVGDTSAEGFMAMARQASHNGIGLTTIGVGVHFGTELANRISSVRGGNLFFFSDGNEMKRTFAKEFDTMVTELAYDLAVTIRPTSGYRLEGVFGVPSNLLRWNGNAIVLDVATIFLSKNRGAIYFALAPTAVGDDVSSAEPRDAAELASVEFSYRNAVKGTAVTGRAASTLVPPRKVQDGLTRGIALVDEYLTLKKATAAFHLSQDPETAFQLVNGLKSRFAAIRDRSLAPERDIIRELHQTLAKASGHPDETRPAKTPPLTAPLFGAWRVMESTSPDVEEGDAMVVWPSGHIECYPAHPPGQRAELADTFQIDGLTPTASSGTFSFEDARHLGAVHFEVTGDSLTLTAEPQSAQLLRLRFVRMSLAELRRGTRSVTNQRTIDLLSGLPARSSMRSTTSGSGER